MYLREEESTTGIGEGIAIPHGKGESVIKPGLAVGLVGGMMAANGKSGLKEQRQLDRKRNKKKQIKLLSI